jgi:serine/threonine protein phosphatase PrpC
MYELKQHADGISCPVEECSSTVASVLVDKRKKRMLCFNLGDGIILATGNGKCKVLSMPEDSSSGCCVTTTRRAASMASVGMHNLDAIDSIVICTDGAWREMYAKNRLKPEVAQILTNNEYDALGEYLNSQNCFDDYSFISLDIRQKIRRNCA